MNFPIELVILAFVFLGIGGLAVMLYFNLRGGKKHEAVSPGALASPDDIPTAPNRDDLVRVSRAEDGRPMIFVHGLRYERLTEIGDARIEQEVIEAIKALIAFAEGHKPASPPAARPTAPPAPRQQAPSQAPLASPPVSPGSSGRIRPPSPDRMLDPLTFVEDIDALVQQRLQAHPDLAQRFVRLTTDGKGGLLIYVDQQRFEAVGDVTDPQVRQVIQEAIRQWEGA